MVAVYYQNDRHRLHLNNAKLVIYRGTSFGFAVKLDNYLDEKFIGQTKGKSFFITTVEPGEHYVIASGEK